MSGRNERVSCVVRQSGYRSTLLSVADDTSFAAPSSARQNMSVSLDQARKAKLHAEQVFHRHGEVAGVGITRRSGGFALKVNFAEEPSDPDNLPPDVDGVPVTIDVVGKVRAQS